MKMDWLREGAQERKGENLQEQASNTIEKDTVREEEGRDEEKERKRKDRGGIKASSYSTEEDLQERDRGVVVTTALFWTCEPTLFT